MAPVPRRQRRQPQRRPRWRIAKRRASRALELDELQQATAGFDEGSGGFGQVFLGEAIPSLAACRGVQRVAVKRADLSKLELSDLRREVEILRRCSHPHLLPLLGYCLDASAACLVFPLMVGGSLQTRLDLTASDCEYLRRMGHFTAAPKPLTWRQKLRVIVQAVDALLWMHTPTEGKDCIWHRDFKCAALPKTSWPRHCLYKWCVCVLQTGQHPSRRPAEGISRGHWVCQGGAEER